MPGENANVCRFLARMAMEQPGHCALVEPRSGDKWTFAEYASMVARAAEHLKLKGIRRVAGHW